MGIRREVNRTVVVVLASLLACTPSRALVSLNDGHDHVYVTGSMTMGWDSNIFANSESKSDYTVSTSILAEYQRRAGWIGVNANFGVDATRFNVFSRENFANPHFGVELTKQTGRTTGSLNVNVSRQSRADAAENLRTTSWNYNVGLNFKYPIVTIYTLSGQAGYSNVKYTTGVFPELATYTAGANLIRIFSTERDVSLGYRYRRSETSTSSSYDDHAFTVGMNGKLIRGINGSLTAGYQFRIPHGFTADGKPQQPFSSWTAAGSATYALGKRGSLTGSLSKDFSTTAVDATVDNTTASLDLSYAYSSHWSASLTGSGGDTRFLGDSGRVDFGVRIPPTGNQRHDDFLSASAGVNYSMNEHLKVGANYTWFKNWSNLSVAEFIRTAYSVTVNSRW